MWSKTTNLNLPVVSFLTFFLLFQPISYSEGQNEALKYIEEGKDKDGLKVKFISNYIGNYHLAQIFII